MNSAQPQPSSLIISPTLMCTRENRLQVHRPLLLYVQKSSFRFHWICTMPKSPMHNEKEEGKKDDKKIVVVGETANCVYLLIPRGI